MRPRENMGRARACLGHSTHVCALLGYMAPQFPGVVRCWVAWGMRWEFALTFHGKWTPSPSVPITSHAPHFFFSHTPHIQDKRNQNIKTIALPAMQPWYRVCLLLFMWEKEERKSKEKWRICRCEYTHTTFVVFVRRIKKIGLGMDEDKERMHV